jgi:hypothetical protein
MMTKNLVATNIFQRYYVNITFIYKFMSDKKLLCAEFFFFTKLK